MKRILTAALLSLGALGLSATQASAFFWKHCCNKCCTICVKPYNAFSPAAFGSICFDGCCPLQTCPPPLPVTKSWGNSAAAGWGWFTRRGRRDSIAWWR